MASAPPDVVRATPKPAKTTHKVAAVIMDEASLFELAVASEVFGLYRPEVGPEWYDFKMCTPGDEPIVTSGGLTISSPHGLQEIREADTIIVTPTFNRFCCEPIIDVLKEAHAAGKRIVSLCSGVFALAATGMLDGLEVATHWKHAAELVQDHPDVRVDAGVLYMANENIYTSAGSAASIDLCLHLVRLDHGAEVANAVARGMVVPPHRDGGQAQYVDHPIDENPGAELFADTLAWAERNLADTITVEDLAARSAMSPRTFARRFKSTTGTTPHHWLTQQRIQLAQRLLETTDHSVARIAGDTGFGTAANLRLHFQRTVHTTPTQYRRTFTCCA